MKKKLGMKWFWFFTKVRPILSLFMYLITIGVFISRLDIYARQPAVIVSVLCITLQTILSLYLFSSSNDFTEKVFKALKLLLITDFFYIIFNQIMAGQINDLISLSVYIMLSFVWVRLNLLYFSKRTITPIPLDSDNLPIDKTDLSAPSKARNTEFKFIKKLSLSPRKYLLTILLTFSLVLNVIQYMSARSLDTQLSENALCVEALTTQIDNLKKRISSLETSNDFYIEELTQLRSINSEYSEALSFYNQSSVFVVEELGNYYLTYEQLMEATKDMDSYSYWTYNPEAAIAQGYKKWK